jgi:putative tricarboxylic transport membrane protein
MISIEQPHFITDMTAILCLAAFAVFISGIFLAKQVVKVLRIPPPIFMPIVLVLCVIGSYALGTNVFNLYLMVPVGILAYFMQSMGYPIAPLVIGVILGPMADENLRRALMVSQGSFLPFFTRPVALILLLAIVWMFVSQMAFYKRFTAWVKHKLFKRKPAEDIGVR